MGRLERVVEVLAIVMDAVDGGAVKDEQRPQVTNAVDQEESRHDIGRRLREGRVESYLQGGMLDAQGLVGDDEGCVEQSEDATLLSDA